MGRHVASTPRIGVFAPSAAHGAGLLENSEVFTSRFEQLDCHAQAGKPVPMIAVSTSGRAAIGFLIGAFIDLSPISKAALTPVSKQRVAAALCMTFCQKRRKEILF